MLGPSCLTQLYFLPLAMKATATPTTLQPLPKKEEKQIFGKGKVFVSEKDQDCQRWPQRSPPGGEGRAGFGEGLYQCYDSWA